MGNEYLSTFFWAGIGISVVIGYWIQDRENKELEKRLDALEKSS